MRRFLASGQEPMAYLAWRRQSVAAQTVYNEAVALRSWLRWLGEAEQAAAIHVRFPPLTPQPPYSDEELGRLFAVATPRERDVCLMLLLTGLRARELLSAKEMDGQMASIMGKGGKPGYVALPFSLDGRMPRSYQTLWRWMNQLGKRAGVRCTPRRFRTTHAHLLLRDYDLQTVQLAMRHSRIATTAHYTRWQAEDRALRAQRALQARWVG